MRDISDFMNRLLDQAKVSKESVDYRQGADHHCGNCVMFHSGTCDLVKGTIESDHLCDRWEAK